MLSKKVRKFGLLRNSAPTLVAILLGLSGVSGASAAIVNFQNTLSGNVYTFQAGIPTLAGTMTTTLKYNLRDTQLNANLPSPGSDRFPDKMSVQCVSGLQNNGGDCGLVGNPNAYQAWGVIPGSPFAADPAGPYGIADYTPYSAFQDEYSIHVILNLLIGGTSVIDSPINKITVINNIETAFSIFNDTVIVSTGLGNLSFRNSFGASGPGIPQVAPLDDVYLEDALLALPSFPAGITNPSQFSLNFNQATYVAFFDTLGPLTATVPEPNALALLVLGLVGLSLVRRKTMV
jgi:hypothetical protein